MQVGRFFSLGNGRVGQYLSSRVLVVRTPFQKLSKTGLIGDTYYFGFTKLNQAQKFAQYLAKSGQRFQLRPSQQLSQYAYEVKLTGQADLPRMLAHWDRRDQPSMGAAMPRASRPQRQSLQA